MAGEIILVVEDNPVNMELVRDLLAAAGYEVLEATTAEEGISLAESAKPDLVLIDIGLPGMDGLEATRRLKGNAKTAAIPVVCITSHAMKGDREKALEAGCVGYLAKPINTRTLAIEVAGFIPESKRQGP